MKLSEQVKPISYLKAHAAEIMRDLKVRQQPLIITQNGEATAVVQDIASYEAERETMALLKILALGQAQIERGEIREASKVLKDIRVRRQKR